MYIRPKHIIVLTIMLFVSTFLLSEFNMLSEADYVCYYTYQYIADGFPAASEISQMDDHARVSLWFYLLFGSAIIMFYFVKNKTVGMFPVGIIIFSAIILSIYLLFANMEVESFYWENVFSPLVIGLTYGVVIFLWRYQFPEIKFKKSKVLEDARYDIAP